MKGLLRLTVNWLPYNVRLGLCLLAFLNSGWLIQSLGAAPQPAKAAVAKPRESDLTPLELTEIDRAFERLYNYDFKGAHVLINQYLAKHPDDPLPYNVRAAAYMFEELGRLKILEAEFFQDDDRLSSKAKLKPDPAVKEKFDQALAEGRIRANKLFAANPKSAEALFQLSFNVGLRSDYLSLVEKKYLASFGLIKESTRYAQQCLDIDPSFGDAYLTRGLSEYIVGSVNVLFRWVVRFDDVRGDKKQGIEILQRTVHTGRYFGPFAKIILALVYLRDKKPAVTIDLLSQLAVDYPENQLIKTELAKVKEEMKAGRIR